MESTAMLGIELDDGRIEYHPEERIAGRISWQLPAAKSIELNLLWYTKGKGSEDAEIVETLRLDGPASAGDQRFDFRLPGQPYSVSGKLLSVIWALELTCEPSRDSFRLDIVMSPTGREIVLGSIPPE